MDTRLKGGGIAQQRVGGNDRLKGGNQNLKGGNQNLKGGNQNLKGGETKHWRERRAGRRRA